MTAEEQAVIDAAKGDNFLGFDDSGNAIIRNAQGQLSAYGGNDWSAVTSALKASHGEKSFNDHIGGEQLKALGGDYQGIDEETGAAVFKKDGQIMGVDKADADYKNLYNSAQKSDPSKTWFNPEYEKQFKEVEAGGAKFSGFDNEGSALFKNKLGQYETVANKDAGFYKFAKKYKADEKFGGVQGSANKTAGENITPVGRFAANNTGTDANKTKQSLANQTGGFSRFSQSSANPAQLQQNNGISASQPTTSTPAVYTPPTVGAKPTQTGSFNASSAASTAKARVLKKKTAAAQPEQVGIKDIALKMGKEYATDFANQKLAEAKSTAQTMASDYAREQSKPYRDQALASSAPILGSAMDSLKGATGIDATKSLTGQAGSAISNVAGFDALSAVNDPKAYLRSQAEGQLNKQLGFDASSIINDPKAFLKKSAGEALNAQLGFNATDLINDPRAVLSKAGTDLLSQYAGDDAGMLGKAATLLRGNVVDNARNLAKDEAKKAALAQAGSVAGIDVKAVQGALDVGKDLLKGGVSENSARKAGETAARAGLSYVSGGVASPESLQMGADLQNKAYDMLQDKLGTVGTVGGSMLKVGAIGNQVAADMAKTGVSAVGDSTATQYKALKDMGSGLKMIGKGDLGGIGDVAKAALSATVQQAVVAPVKIAKAVVASVSNAISSIFCFDGDTEILMENGKYKKIKDIQLGDRVELGGLVTAIGQSASNEIYDYNGVKVSAGHALFEDGKWTRVSESKYGKEIKGDERVVFPMSTEHHLIVTNGQIWADNLEVDDTYDFKDSEILKQLNKKTVRNKMLKTYLKVKFGIS